MVNFVRSLTIVGALMLMSCPGNRVCTSDLECGPMATCNSEGVCSSGCRSDADCVDGESCVDSACLSRCQSHGECQLGFLCEEGNCQPGCSPEAPCPEGMNCRENQCQEGCVADGDCPPGSYCGVGNECLPFSPRDAGPRDCNGHNDCRVGEYCTDAGRCLVGCRGDNACPNGFYCGDEHRCVRGERELVDGGPGQDGGTLSDGGTFVLNCGVLGQEGSEPRVIINQDFTLYAEDAGGQPLLRISWDVAASAGGDGLVFETVGDSSPNVRVPRAGRWTFQVVAYRASGERGQCVVSLEAGPPEQGFFMQLGWDGDRDLDLHMVPVRHVQACENDDDCEGAGRQCNLNFCSMAFDTQEGSDSDCWPRQPDPAWSAEEAPHFVHDIRDGAGTEYIRAGSLAMDSSYRIAIRSWANRTNSAVLKAWLNGDLLVETESFRLGPANNRGWFYVGRLSPTDGSRLAWTFVGELSRDVPRD